MIVLYGDYDLSFTISGSHSGASFVTDSKALNNGRAGDGCTMTWVDGTQATTSYVEITVNIVSPLDSTPAIGGLGIVNARGLPINLKTTVHSVDQRLVYGPRMPTSSNPSGDPCAWFLPRYNASSIVVRIWNDDGTITPPMSPLQEFYIGEIIVGRTLSLPALINQDGPSRSAFDPTAYQSSSGGSRWQTMRKPLWNIKQRLGIFSPADIFGGSLSSIADGGNPGSQIDINQLIMLLAQSQFCAVCDVPNLPGYGSVTNGLRYDQNQMQKNWLMCRPTNLDQAAITQAPFGTWAPTWSESY